MRPEPEFLNFMSPGIDSKESIPPAYVAFAGRYNNPIPTRFLLAPIDCLKIPALICEAECKIAARPRLSSTAIILIAASAELIAPLQSAIRLLTCGRDP